VPHAMRANFGLSLSTRAVLFDWGTLDDLIAAAQVAEVSGYFDSVWVGDNLLSKPRVEAIVTLSALAARTEQVRLGTICLASFPLRDPILLALQWATVQQPIPILIAVNPKEERVDAATTDRILRRVAAHADGWQTDVTPVETFRRRFETIQHYAAQQGRDGGQFESCLHLMVNINADRDRAFDEATTFLRSYYGAGAVSRERAEMWLAYGSPQAVIDKIAAYIDAGCTTPVLRFVSPHPTAQLQRCIEEVLPAFRVS
jgi:alkanesulfonate monooxygenase SsuD/methylene tetrahydromethanopterin reductase-like flavin-dependent oxidoreductase (luciferase family)